MPQSSGSRPAAEPPAFAAWHWSAIAAATLLAAALRLCELGTWSFWIDEGHTFRDATMPLFGENGFLSQQRALYPLPFLGLRLLLAIGWLDPSEGSLRLPFAMAGIATVPLLAVCGRRIVGAGAAVLASAFLAIDPWHLFWSQNARGYVGVVLASVAAVAFAHRWAATGRARDLAWACLFLAVGILCHLTTVFLAAGLLAHAWLRRVRTWNRRTVAVHALAVAFAVLLVPMAALLLAEYLQFLQAKDAPSVQHFALTTLWYFRPLLLLAAGVGLLLAARSIGPARALLLGCLLLVPFLLLAAIGGSVAKTTARFAICTLPIVLWLAALCCVQMAAWLGRATRVRPAAARCCALALPLAIAVDFTVEDWNYYHGQHGGRARWREACAHARQVAGAGNLRVLTINEPTVLYYLRPDHWLDQGASADPRVQVHPLTSWLVAGQDRNGTVFHPPGGREHFAWHRAAARRERAQLVVLVSLPELQEMDADGSLWRTLRSDFELALHLPCWIGPKDESLWVFVPNGS